MIKDNEKSFESEILSPDDRRVAEMLGNLRVIEAPKNFEHRLKARIANSLPARNSRAGFFPILRYVLPLSLFLFVGAVFMWSSSPDVDLSSVQPVAESVRPLQPIVESREIETVAAAPQMSDSMPVKFEESAVRQVKTPPRKIEKTTEVGISSVDKALKAAPKTILPRGFDSEPVEPKVIPEDFDNRRKFTAKEALSMIGVEAEFEGNSWKVKAVLKNSPADISGINVGDVMEAIDGRPLNGKTVFTFGVVSVKTIKIIRDSKSLLINLKNK